MITDVPENPKRLNRLASRSTDNPCDGPCTTPRLARLCALNSAGNRLQRRRGF